jgi:rhamnulokinase
MAAARPRLYLAADLGAESGRVMAGAWDGRRVALREAHRFPNPPLALGGRLRWDVGALWQGVQAGLAAAARDAAGAVRSVGVDTWGVDFALLSRSGELLGLPHHYRDGRTAGVMAQAFARVPRAEIFAATGVQFMELNTLYQCLALQRDSPELLAAADRLLLMPDLLHWALGGVAAVEFTNATTTQMLDPHRRAWAAELLARLGLPLHPLREVVPPGTVLGPLRPEVRAAAGLGPGVRVTAPATHDTASAVAAVPTDRTGGAGWAYISSGTWSLVGVECAAPRLSPAALAANVTNEGGVGGTWRVLKNVLGLWLVQQCRRSFAARGGPDDYAALVGLAAAAPPRRALVEPDDPRFLNPADMPAALRAFCRDTGQPGPDTEGALVRCCLESLALKYAAVLAQLEAVTGMVIEVVHILGGGARNALLNQLTADAGGRPVLAGPAEATALGNVLVQAWADGELGSLAELRAVVRASAAPELFLPRPDPAGAWAEARARFARLASG